MKKEKATNTKKLGKAHIWPSVVFIVLAFLTALSVFMEIMIMTLAELAQDRYESACAKATLAAQTFRDHGSNPETLLNSIMCNTEYKTNIFILDEDGSVIVGSGEQTYIDDIFDIGGSTPEAVQDYNTIADSSTEAVSKKGARELGTYIWNAIKKNKKILESTEGNISVLDLPFWLKSDLSDGRTVMMKCTVSIYSNDLSRSLIIAMLAFFLMMIPILFLFINVIIGVINQRRMTRLLYYNTVTGGRSYIYFEHTAASTLGNRRNAGSCFMFVDFTLMKYRSYCNYHGIHAGEDLLGTVDKKINEHLQKNEVCALSGKSSFALFMKCADHEAGKERVEQLIQALSSELNHNSGVVFHAGICYAAAQPAARKKDIPAYDASVYFNCAGAARASIGDENICGCAVYDEKLMEEQIWEHKVEEKMTYAIENEEFKVYIQPKYDPSTEKLAGAEALVRWINDEDGFISPGRFIPIFEKNGFITKLDDYMLEHIAKLQSGWIAEGKSVVPVSVNVSRAHFANPELASHICEIVDRYNVPHNLIEIELTESAFFDDRTMLLRTVHSLRSMGFEISMDDFGAGYSSLNSLKDMPLDVLKLDADFFRGEDSQERGEIVVAQAIKLAKQLNMRIVAEGIEKKEQVDFLAQNGCDMIQGYYFAKPMPANEYAQKL